MNRTQQPSFAGALPPLLFVTSIFLINFLSRTALAPLLPAVEADLGLAHAGAGRLFLLVGGGNALGLLCNGFVSKALNHRRTVALSALAAGLALLCAAAAPHMAVFRLSLFAMGVCLGFYLPSGVATVVSLVSARDWGKAISIHEIAPNLSYALAPLLAEAMLRWFSWRTTLGLLGVLQLAAGLAFVLLRGGTEQRGESPRPEILRRVLARPVFWGLAAAFGLAIGASFGTYAMTTLYLVERGLPRAEANTLLTAARAAALVAAFGAGWLVDRLGPRGALRIYFTGAGLTLVAVGLAPAGLLPVAVAVQACFSVFYFPAGFAALSGAFPGELRSVAVSLAVPLGMVGGLGCIPPLLGLCGDAGLFGAGFVLLGLAVCAGLLLLPLFRPVPSPAARLDAASERG